MDASLLYLGFGVFTLSIILIAIAGIKLSRKVDKANRRIDDALQRLTEQRLILIKIREMLLTEEQMGEVEAYVRASGAKPPEAL